MSKTTDELLGKLGKQMREFPTFPGAKQAEKAIAQPKVTEISAPSASSVPTSLETTPEEPNQEVSKRPKSRHENKSGEKSVRNFSVTLHPSDIEAVQEIRFLIMKEAKKPTVSISETLRVAVRAFRSSKPLSEIIKEVEQLDGRGMWRK